jgi:hypothetical protein
METGFPVAKGSAVVTSAWLLEGPAVRTTMGTISLALLVTPAAETHAPRQAASVAEAPVATSIQWRRAPSVPRTSPPSVGTAKGRSSCAVRIRPVAAMCASLPAARVARTTTEMTSPVVLAALAAATLAPLREASAVTTMDTCTPSPRGQLVRAKVCSAPTGMATSSCAARIHHVAGTCVPELAACVARTTTGTTSCVGRGASAAAMYVAQSSEVHWSAASGPADAT